MAASIHRQCGQAAFYAPRPTAERTGGQDPGQAQLSRSDRQILGATGLVAENPDGRTKGARFVFAAPNGSRRGRP